MSLDQETINAQLELLAAHRRTLAALLQQAAQFSAGHLPAHIVNGIAEARANIARIKAYLHENSVPVEDEPNDDAPPSSSPDATQAAHLIAEQRAQDVILETYFDRMTELLIDKSLLISQPGDALRAIARTRTLAAMRRLDGDHNNILADFLRDAGLLTGHRGKPVIFILDMSDADLHGADLHGVDLYEANLERANLRGANLQGTFLLRANLQGSFLEEADLQKVNLERARLDGANLNGVNLRKGHLQATSLRGAILRGANLEGGNLRLASLEWADLHQANLEGANLYCARLRGAKLQNAKLQGANLYGADLQGANLQGANLQGAILNRSNLSNADLRGADLREATLCGADLSSTNNLEDAKVDGAKYNTKPTQETVEGELVIDEQLMPELTKPTLWPQEFNRDRAGALNIT